MDFVDVLDSTIRRLVYVDGCALCQERLNKYERSQLSESEVPGLKNYTHMPYPNSIPPVTDCWVCEIERYEFDDDGFVSFTVHSYNTQEPYDVSVSVDMYGRKYELSGTIPNLAYLRLNKEDGYVYGETTTEPTITIGPQRYTAWFTREGLKVKEKHKKQGRHKRMYQEDIPNIIFTTFNSDVRYIIEDELEQMGLM